MKKLVKNMIMCKNCGDVLESTFRHDFKMCHCGQCYIDGGLDYQRIGGNLDEIENLAVYEDVPGYYVEYATSYKTYRHLTSEEPNEIIKHWEGDAGYKIRLTTEDGEFVYETSGFSGD